MKRKLMISVVGLMPLLALAHIIAPFPGWEDVKDASSSIVVVLCGKPVPQDWQYSVSDGPSSDSEVDVVAVLKGTNALGSARLQTDHELRSGEHYLVFGNFNQNICTAYEPYKVVPIGRFSTNSIAGKPLDEQIKVLFQHSLFKINRELQRDQEQKQQLETLVPDLVTSKWGTPSNGVQMSIALDGGNRDIKLHEPFQLLVQFKNFGSSAVWSYIYLAANSEPGNGLRCVVISPSGKDISPNRKIDGGSGFFVNVPSNGTDSFKFNLPSICKFDEVGTYKITAQKTIGQSNQWWTVTSNPLLVKVVSK